MSSFTQKKINITLVLDADQFSDGSNTLLLTGHRVLAEIKNVGAFGQGTMSTVKIFGMAQSDMNRLSLLNFNALVVRRNKIIVSAGDDKIGMFDVFAGQIINAWADYSGMPEVALVIQANPAYYWQIATAEPTSYPTIIDAGVALADLARRMGMTFTNNGVKKFLTTPYLSGSLIDQARAIVKAIDAIMIIDGDSMTITEQGLPLAGEIPLISADTGLIGYPAWSQNGITISTLFNPAIRMQGQVELETDIDIAKGRWIVLALSYRLESENPSGAWFCQVELGRFGNAITAL